MPTLNKQMIPQHVRQANKMWICHVDNISVIKQIHEFALESNPRRATPNYISMIMTNEDYLGADDGLNNPSHIRNVLNRENIFCGKYNSAEKLRRYYEEKAQSLNSQYLTGKLI